MIDPFATHKAYAHFARRALERHGLTLKESDVRALCQAIVARDFDFLTWSHGPGFRAFYRVWIPIATRHAQAHVDRYPTRSALRAESWLAIEGLGRGSQSALGSPYIVLYDFELDTLITIYHNSWLREVDGCWVPRKRRRKPK